MNIELMLYQFNLRLTTLKIPKWRKCLMTLGVSLFLAEEVE